MMIGIVGILLAASYLNYHTICAYLERDPQVVGWFKLSLSHYVFMLVVIGIIYVFFRVPIIQSCLIVELIMASITLFGALLVNCLPGKFW